LVRVAVRTIDFHAEFSRKRGGIHMSTNLPLSLCVWQTVLWRYYFCLCLWVSTVLKNIKLKIKQKLAFFQLQQTVLER